MAGGKEQLTPGSRRERLVIGLALGWAGLLLIVDQWTKVLVESKFRLHESRPVIDGFFSLTYVVNRGAAWSILEGYGWLLLTVAAVVLAGAVIFFRYLADGWIERYFALLTIIAGIVGNSIDRIWRGGVVDFFDVYYRHYHYPIFNVADCAICAGVGVFLLSSLLRPSARPTTAGDR